MSTWKIKHCNRLNSLLTEINLLKIDRSIWVASSVVNVHRSVVVFQAHLFTSTILDH